MNHKRRRPKHRRAGCLMCKPHKDDRGQNGAHQQTQQEQRQLVADRLDQDRVDPMAHLDEPAPQCAHCKGSVCTSELCLDHLDDCELDDGRWVCSRACWDAIVDALDAPGPARLLSRS